MSAMKTLLMEYQFMGNKFNYTSHKDIPKSVVNMIEDLTDNFKEVPLSIINNVLTDIFKELQGS